MPTIDVLAIFISALALVISLISLRRTFSVDIRDRRRAAIEFAIDIKASLEGRAERTTALVQEWEACFAAQGRLKSGARETKVVALARLSGQLRALEEAIEERSRRINRLGDKALEKRLVELKEIDVRAKALLAELAASETDLKLQRSEITPTL